MGRFARTLFELETANRALPLVRSIVNDVVTDFHALRSLSQRKKLLCDGTDGSVASLERLRGLGGDVEEYSTRIEGYLRELEELGLELRDLETGAVDFPTLMEGEPAFLCWRLGEDEVAWWHAASTGYADRQPIPQRAQGALRASS